MRQVEGELFVPFSVLPGQGAFRGFPHFWKTPCFGEKMCFLFFSEKYIPAQGKRWRKLTKSWKKA